MTFAADYRRIVVPKLRRMAAFQGLRVAIGSTSLSEALAAILRQANRLGASHLPDDIRADLEDAVADWLMAAIDDVLPAWDGAEALATRVAIDLARWEATA